MKSDFFLWIYSNKLDVSVTLQLIVTVSQRRHFCHFETNSGLLWSGTQTHRLSVCVCVCVCARACVRVKEPLRVWSTLLQVWKRLHIFFFTNTELAVLTSSKVMQTKETDWNVGMRWKCRNIFSHYIFRLWRAATVLSMYGKHCEWKIRPNHIITKEKKHNLLE